MPEIVPRLDKMRSQAAHIHGLIYLPFLLLCVATPPSILAWRIPRTEEPGGLRSTGSPRGRHDWSDLAHMHVFPAPSSLYKNQHISDFISFLRFILDQPSRHPGLFQSHVPLFFQDPTPLTACFPNCSQLLPGGCLQVLCPGTGKGMKNFYLQLWWPVTAKQRVLREHRDWLE